MTQDVSPRARELFEQLSELPADQRAERLDQSCAENPALRSEVEDLLRSFDAASTFLETPAAEDSRIWEEDSDSDGVQDAIGQKIDGFTVHRLIATGGMGAVYEASQDHPARQVALKILKPSAVSPSSLRRFEFESEILGRLRHPGIAQIHAAGTFKNTHGATQPYFAMEFLPKAKTIIDYARDVGLRREDKVRLFLGVAEAVHHGHQRGVIHRDLKPGNILVDAAGQAKVIDFGVARSTNADLLTTTAHTRTGQIIGTLAYMSPEQCDADPENLDIRSDVYSLGVVLYELICGELPYQIQGAGLITGARMLREQSPRRPRSFDPSLPSDLEAILLKALEKAPAERYQSADQLAEDLRRFVNHEPVLAKPQSRFYHLRRFAQRNPALMGAFALLVVVLIAATAISAKFALDASREIKLRRLAEAAEAEKRTEAEQNHAVAVTINKFLVEMLGQASPHQNPNSKETTIREAADFAAKKIEESDLEPIIVEGRVRNLLASFYRGLGDYEGAAVHEIEAIRILEQELGAEHPDTLVAISHRAHRLIETGNFEESMNSFQEIRTRMDGAVDLPLNLRVKVLNDLALATLQARGPEPAFDILQEALAIVVDAEAEASTEVVSETHQSLGGVYARLGKYQDGEREYRVALTMRREAYGNNHSTVAQSLNGLSEMMQRLGQLEESERLARECLAVSEFIYEPGHPRIARAINNVAIRLQSRGMHDHAIPYFERAVALWRDNFPDGHPDLATGLLNLGAVMYGQDRFEEAEQYWLESLEEAERVFGDHNHPVLATILENLGDLLSSTERRGQAVSRYEEALEIRRALDGTDPVQVGRCLTSLGIQCSATNQLDRAEVAFVDALETMRGLPLVHPALQRTRYAFATCRFKRTLDLPRNSPERVRILTEVADLIRLSVSPAEAIPHIQEAIRVCEELGEQDSVLGLQAKSVYGASLLNNNRFDDAEHYCLHAFWTLSELDDVTPEDLRPVMERLVELYEAWDEEDEAEAWRMRIEDELPPTE